MSSSPASTASSTTYWMAGLSTTGNISLGVALVAGRNLVPSPAAGITAFVTLMSAPYGPRVSPAGSVWLRERGWICCALSEIVRSFFVHAAAPVTMGAVETTELDRVQAKRELRGRLLSARAELTPEQLSAAGRSLAAQVLARPDVTAARTVALYASAGTEPATGRLRAELRSRGVNVLLPVLRPDGDLDWAPDQGDASLVPGRFGIKEPAGPWLGRNALAAAQVVLVPALAVDSSGARLGRGGGSYDRALPRVPEGVPVLALLHTVREGLPTGVIAVEDHDAPVTGWVAATP